MKKLVLTILYLPVIMHSQIKKDENGIMYFEKVYEVDGNKAEIHSIINEWIAINFNDSNHVIKINTEDKIVNNGIFNTTYNYQGIVVELTNEFDMINEFKDGKYRLILDNVTYKTPNGDPTKITYSTEGIDKETFLKEYKEMIDNMEDGYVKKVNQKIIKNEKKFDEHWKKVSLARRLIYDSVTEEIENIATDLNKYVIENLNKDDW